MFSHFERTLPVIEPFLIEQEGRTQHPLRGRHPLMVFVSVAGFPEGEVFDQLTNWVQSVYVRAGAVVAEIYRPAAETMATPYFRDKADDILAATSQASREIVESMQVQPETMKRIKQGIAEDISGMHKMGNLFWKSCIAEGVTPKEFAEKGLVPRPDSIESFMIFLPLGFNSNAAGDTSATIQFNFDNHYKPAATSK
jgi:hypothetical protein